MTTFLVSFILALTTTFPHSDPPASSAKGEPLVADHLTLKDGKPLIGLILDSNARTGTRVIVRREWVRQNLPDQAKRWERTEATETAKATQQSKERLTQWRSERTGNDKLSLWIDDQLASIGKPSTESPLMTVTLARTEIKAIKKADPKSKNALRLAWSSGIPNPELRTPDNLKSALESRGLLLDDSPVDLSPQLPPRLATDLEWLGRRAATEILFDEGLRLIRYGSMVMPEPTAGAAPSPDLLVGAVGDTLRELLGDRLPSDPMAPHFRNVESRHRVGLMVTQVEPAQDGRGTRATCTLWLKAPGGWINGLWRASTVDPARIPVDAADDLMNDPQVASIFRVVDSLGLGSIDPQLKRQALLGGESARRALGLARAQFQRDLERLNLMTTAPATKPASAAKP